ncbi:MAG: hypothetical protein ACYDHD_00655 [Vulcanimicrobiaceae bacterium]
MMLWFQSIRLSHRDGTILSPSYGVKQSSSERRINAMRKRFFLGALTAVGIFVLGTAPSEAVPFALHWKPKRTVALAPAGQTVMVPVVSHAATNRTPRQLYQDAVTTMEAMPQPPFVTTSTHLHANGMGFHMQDIRGWASTAILLVGGVHSAEWKTFYRSDDDLADIVTANGKHLLAREALFNPTWLGAADVLRYGFPGDTPWLFQAKQTSTRSPVSAAPPSAAPAANGVKLRTIAIVRAIAPPAYRVIDAGPARCGTSMGRHLRLLAYDPRNHPLTDVIVDLANNRFCMMRFNIGDPAVAAVRGFYEIHFSQENRYWMVKNGLAAFYFRFLGIPLQKTTLAFSYHEFTFPKSIAASVFSRSQR